MTNDVMMSKLGDAELRNPKKFQALTLNHQPTKTQGQHLSRTTQEKMKYSEACLLKKQVDGWINKLTQNLMGANQTNMVSLFLKVHSSANMGCRPTCQS